MHSSQLQFAYYGSGIAVAAGVAAAVKVLQQFDGDVAADAGVVAEAAHGQRFLVGQGGYRVGDGRQSFGQVEALGGNLH